MDILNTNFNMQRSKLSNIIEKTIKNDKKHITLYRIKNMFNMFFIYESVVKNVYNPYEQKKRPWLGGLGLAD